MKSVLTTRNGYTSKGVIMTSFCISSETTIAESKLSVCKKKRGEARIQETYFNETFYKSKALQECNRRLHFYAARSVLIFIRMTD